MSGQGVKLGSSQARQGHVRPCQATSSQARSGQAREALAMSGQAMSGQARWPSRAWYGRVRPASGAVASESRRSLRLKEPALPGKVEPAEARARQIAVTRSGLDLELGSGQYPMVHSDPADVAHIGAPTRSDKAAPSLTPRA